MAQILQGSSSLGNLGSAFGSGISSALQNLANLKSQKLHQQQHRQQAFSAFQDLGFDPQESIALAQLPENLQMQVIKSYWQRGGSDSLPQEMATQQFLPKTEQQEQQSERQGIEKILGPLTKPVQTMSVLDLLMRGIEQQAPQQLPTLQSSQPNATLQPSPTVGVEPKPVKPRTIASTLREAPPAEKRAQRQLELAEKALELKQKAAESKERGDKFKFNKEEIKEVRNAGKAAKEDLRDLERLEELEKEGKLDTPGYVALLERSGLDIPALMNEGSQEFQKVAQTFMRNAKQYLGARISNFELEQFLKTIPSLSQSPEGRKRVISNLKQMARTKVAYQDALQEILQENGNVPPYDLTAQIDKKIDKKIDAISKKFKEDISKPVPKGQNRLITALQAGAGSLGGAVAPALPGAALGALAGGPGGALIGGGLGLAGGALSKILAKLLH